jgi:hypothetical protein
MFAFVGRPLAKAPGFVHIWEPKAETSLVSQNSTLVKLIATPANVPICSATASFAHQAFVAPARSPVLPRHSYPIFNEDCQDSRQEKSLIDRQMARFSEQILGKPHGNFSDVHFSTTLLR